MDPLVFFCEQSFLYSPNIKEFYNSVSNIFYLISAFYIYKVYPKKDFLFLGNLFLIGVGSFMFHSSGTFKTELLDEIPMITFLDIVISRVDRFSLTRVFLSFTVISFYILSQNYRVFHSYFAFQCLFAFYKIKLLSEKNQRILKNFWISLGIFGMGKICWLIEQNLCHLDSRISIFHSFWHFFSAMAIIPIYDIFFQRSITL